MLSDLTTWNALGIASQLVLWLLVLFLSFLLLGTLRSLGLVRWRMEQLEATTPSRLGRCGLKIGKKAPDFTLPSLAGTEVALHDFAGRKVLLVFTQSGCGPCETILPELNRLMRRGVQVLVVNKGELDATRKWTTELGLHFPVRVQNGLDISKKYEVFATPFAFLINEQGVIASKGIVSSSQHIRYVLSGADGAKNGHPESQFPAMATTEFEASRSQSTSSKENHHV
jgi:methylamine dehydrogenase accessory protein MauD